MPAMTLERPKPEPPAGIPLPAPAPPVTVNWNDELDEHTAPRLTHVVTLLLVHGKTDVRVDLSRCPWLSEEGILALLRLRRNALRRGALVRVITGAGQPGQKLRAMHLAEHLA
jgi:hypothetical protein